jgi:integrase
MHIAKRHAKHCRTRQRKSARCNCDGKWRARYPHPSPPPHQPTAQIERTFRHRKDAEQWLASQQHHLLSGTHVLPQQSKTTYAVLTEAWEQTWRTIEPKTAAGYRSILNTHLLPEFGATQLQHLTPQRIDAYLSQLTKHGVSPGTQRNIFAALRTSLNTAVRLRLVGTNPTAGIRPPRPTRKPMLYLTAEEVRRLADAIPSEHRTLVYAAAYTGLRAGELLALQVRDFNQFNNTFHVHRALKEVNGVLSFGPTKTHTSRTVSLPHFLAKMLAGHLDRPHSLASGDSLIFSGPIGSPLRHGNFYRYVFRPAAKTALPHKAELTFHSLRHTAVALAVEAGVHPKQIQEMLGHSSITVTLDTYGGLFPSAHEALASALDAAFAATQVDNVAELRL